MRIKGHYTTHVGFRFSKLLFTILVLFSFAGTACAQDDKSKKVKTQNQGKVNMKELQEKEKRTADSLKKTKYETGPEQNTKSKPLPPPKDSAAIKSNITPGEMKRDTTRKKNKR